MFTGRYIRFTQMVYSVQDTTRRYHLAYRLNPFEIAGYRSDVDNDGEEIGTHVELKSGRQLVFEIPLKQFEEKLNAWQRSN